MQIKSIVAGAAVALVASFGTSSADEDLTKADEIRAGQFFTLAGIDAQALDSSELAAVTGGEWWAFSRMRLVFTRSFDKPPHGSTSIHGVMCFGGGAPTYLSGTHISAGCAG